MQSDLTLLEQVKLGKIWDFPGGVHPPERKHLSNGTAIATLPMPDALYIPLKQHIGSAGELIVSPQQQVKKGQALTKANSGLSLPVHAPTSGLVKEVVNHVSAHPSGIAEPTLVLIPDGLDESIESQPMLDWHERNKADISAHLQEMAVAGLGGATFPTYVKTNNPKPVELLIINAVECEPYITSDDVLMREHAAEIILGCQILAHATGAKQTLIGMEDNKPEAIESMRAALTGISDIEVRVVPTKYPSGGEKQLIQLLTNQQVPSGGLPLDLGISVQNVGTAFAVKKAIIDGLPLTNRVVTVTGESITNPQNLWVPFGTQVKDLLAHAGMTADKNQRVIMGGPMMGFNIMDGAMPVVKATNCILAANDYYMPLRETEQACIRCGDCAAACPAELLPQQMLWFSKAQDQEKLEEYNLFDCIECGACAYVCPSQIPLVQYYRTSKAEIRQAKEDKIKAEKAKLRFEQRQERLEKEKEARLQRHKEAAERRRNAMANDTSAKDKIAAALARAKAKKEGAETTEPAPAAEAKDKVAQAIARAKAKKAVAKSEVSTEKSDASTETSETSTKASESTGDSNKDRVAAAIARAKAKKAAAQAKSSDEQEPVESNSTEQTVDAEQAKKDKVAAAIARAKAKKAAKSENTEATESSAVETSELTDAEQAKKDKVAAAIARAKAKKTEKEANADKEVDAPVTQEQTETIDPEQAKKDKVAAAIARAKAKKATKEADLEQQNVTDSAQELETEAPDPEQAKKDKVAATIARAKAKKAAKESELELESVELTDETSDKNSAALTDTPEQVTESEQEQKAEVIDPEQAKKAKVATAIARAKAKKAAKEAEQSGEQE